MFGLIDCNNFYASCERVFRPDLNTKPVAILSNNDGCIIARSDEVKALGISMGAPCFKYKKLIETHNVQIFSANFPLYGDMSKRVMSILSMYAPEMEVYSIDEAFLKFGNCSYISFDEYGERIKRKVQKSTGIPISVGFGTTKALSKVANRIAKKFPKETGGVYVIDTEEKRKKALKWLKIEDVWGIGRKNSVKLQQKWGIANALAFTEKSDEWARKHFSVVGLRLKNELEGKIRLDFEEKRVKKSIATTRTFEENYRDYPLIKERISTFAVCCAEKLRKEKATCSTIMVFLRTNVFRKDLPQYQKKIVFRLPFATNSNIELVKFAIHALNMIFEQGYAYKKAGVVALDISSEDSHQINLFTNTNPKHKRLMKAIDTLNDSIGKQKVKLATQDLGRTWKMKQEKLSNRFTTQLDEILEVKS